MMLERKIELYGAKELDTSDVKVVLRTLFYDEEKSLAELCRIFEASRPAMAACLRRNGFDLKYSKQTKIEYLLDKKGYRDLGEFFEKHWNMTFSQMATELGVFPRTISKEYKKYRAEKKAAETKEETNPAQPQAGEATL